MAFIAGPCLSGMTAPWVLDGPMDGDAFHVYVQQVLAPTLRRGNVVVLDNLPAHKVGGIREAIAARRAQIFYLPPYGLGMNPIESAFAKLKALLRHAPAGSLSPKPSVAPEHGRTHPVASLGCPNAWVSGAGNEFR
jgi:transposase